MGVKVVFIGNKLSEDDGIGPQLYDALKEDEGLERFELLELGVIGLDLINYVTSGDQLIIVDALRAKDKIGDVVVLDEKDLKSAPRVVSMHDFGVEQTAEILRLHIPDLKPVKVIGITVKAPKAFAQGLSPELEKLFPQVTRTVKEEILRIAKK